MITASSTNTTPSNLEVHDEDYPLEDKWTLKYKPTYQYQRQQSETDWLNSFQMIHNEINSIEIFWRVFNNIPSWHDLHSGTIYAFFKQDINPSWEDKMNEKGCSYMFYINRNRVTENDLNQIFIDCLLFFIGNMSIYHQFLNGVTFERKNKGDKLIVWCSAHSDEMLNCVIENIFQQDVRDYLTIKNVELSDSRYKVITKVIDHQSELKRLRS
jgi:hypothetical protein